MYYYKRNIGDYYKKAGRLTMLQHGAYTQLIDACYDREVFPTLDEAIEWTWASTEEEIQAVKFVLQRFFTLEDGVYSQHRINEEVENFKKNGETNRRIALEREEKRRQAKAKRDENSTNRDSDSTNRDNSVNDSSTKHAQDVNEPPPNQEPRTKNQEPLKEPMSSKPDTVVEIFNYWKEVFAKKANTTLSTKRKAKIKQRLQDGYSIEEIKQAIFNCSNTPHNMGLNDRNQKFDDIELICRSAEHLERFRDNPGVNHGTNQQRVATTGRKLTAVEENNARLLEKYGNSTAPSERTVNPTDDSRLDQHEVSRGVWEQVGVSGVTIDMDSRDFSDDNPTDPISS